MTYVVTLELDSDSFNWLNGLRKQHFPADRNVLDAHLTLFHKLDDDGAEIAIEQAGHQHFAIELIFAGFRSLGRGVAVSVISPELVATRARLATALSGRLTRQDAQTFRPHVTVQNKVDPAVAQTLLDELQAIFITRQGRGTAILIWEYLQGPWRLRDRIEFRSANN